MNPRPAAPQAATAPAAAAPAPAPAAAGLDPAAAGAADHLGPPPPVGGMADVLAALADPIRLSIVRALACGELERSCGQFDLPVHKSTLTHHFRTLRDAGLIDARYEGKRKYIHLRRADVEAVFPGLIDSVVQERRETPTD